ncbi:MAG: glutamine amidotransferase-related protein [Planctomycetota bacterium]
MAILFFELDQAGNPSNLGRTLRAFGQKITLVDARRPVAMPVDLDEVHGVIVSGGNGSSGASASAIEAIVRDAAKAEIPVLGIGAGSRLVARALGGEIGTASERGIVGAKLSPVGREEPLFAGQPWSSQQAVWNDEVVAKLPEGGRALGSTPAAKFAAWGLGPWVVGIDWHFEWSAAEIAECAKAQGAVSSNTIADIERLGRLFAERVSMVLMPVDRMVSGRAKDVRH